MVLFFFFFCKKVLMFRCENKTMYDVSLVHRKPSDIYPPPQPVLIIFEGTFRVYTCKLHHYHPSVPQNLCSLIDLSSLFFPGLDFRCCLGSFNATYGSGKKIKRHSTTTFPSRRVGVSVCVCVCIGKRVRDLRNNFENHKIGKPLLASPIRARRFFFSFLVGGRVRR